MQRDYDKNKKHNILAMKKLQILSHISAKLSNNDAIYLMIICNADITFVSMSYITTFNTLIPFDMNNIFYYLMSLL